MKQDERHGTLMVVVAVLVFVICLIATFAVQSWLVSLVLCIFASACVEYLGEEGITRWKWLNRLSVEHAGFSIARIALGVLVVLVFAGVLVLGRLIYLRLFD